MDKHLNMQRHVSQVIHSCNFHLRNIGRIRQCLTKDIAASLVHSLVATRLDYGNALLYGVPSSSTAQLQKVLNTAARIVTCTRRFEPVSPRLKDLHWLRVEQRIQYKILVTTFKALLVTASSYIKELRHHYVSA